MYKTSDIYIVATLVTLHFPVEHIDTSNPTRAVFHFAEDQALRDAVDSYHANLVTVNPRELLLNLRRLKGRIFEALEGNQ